MFYFHKDPVFRHHTLNQLLNTVTLQKLFPSNRKAPRQESQAVLEALDDYKKLAQALQYVWWDGQEAPPMFRAGGMRYLDAGPELDEILGLEVFGASGKAAELADEALRYTFVSQPTLHLVKGALDAFNNVSEVKHAAQYALALELKKAQDHARKLVAWFENLVRNEPSLHQLLLDHLLAFYSTREEAEEEYQRYLDMLQRFRMLSGIAVVHVPEPPPTPAVARSYGGLIGVMAVVGAGAYYISQKIQL